MTSSFARHSRFSDPGALAPWLADVEPDIGRLHAAASGLVFHYWAHGDVTAHGFVPERVGEINLRYADTMFVRLRELNPAPLSESREPTERMVGCCRDFTLLLVALARQHGIPARTGSVSPPTSYRTGRWTTWSRSCGTVRGGGWSSRHWPSTTAVCGPGIARGSTHWPSRSGRVTTSGSQPSSPIRTSAYPT
jgi:hypothetical protein